MGGSGGGPVPRMGATLAGLDTVEEKSRAYDEDKLKRRGAMRNWDTTGGFIAAGASDLAVFRVAEEIQNEG